MRLLMEIINYRRQRVIISSIKFIEVFCPCLGHAVHPWEFKRQNTEKLLSGRLGLKNSYLMTKGVTTAAIRMNLGTPIFELKKRYQTIW